MKKELITLIVPVYNVEKYLIKCVDSLLKQTYDNLEIILVDDGSTDNSSKLCDEYQKKDKRIKVIHKENGGLSDARNVAIDKAHGKYISFVDSDDFIACDMIELLYKNVIDNKADIAICGYQNTNEDEEINDNNIDYKELVYSNQEALETMLYQKDCTTSAWAKLYKTTLFKDIRYPKGKICEDLDTTYLLFAQAKKIVINNQKKYFYLQRKNSIINSQFNPKRMDALKFAKKETKFIKKEFPSIVNSAINREFMEAIFILNKLSYKGLTSKAGKEIVKTIKNNRKVVLHDKKSKKIYRLYALISYLGTPILLTTLKIKLLFR